MRLGIKEGDDLLTEETENGLPVHRVPDLIDLVGVDAKYATLGEAREIVEGMREEY